MIWPAVGPAGPTISLCEIESVSLFRYPARFGVCCGVGFQFAHLESYARSVSKLKGAQRAAKGSRRDRSSGGWSARDVLAEALREAGACPHVDAPQPPEVLLGDLQQLADEIDREPAPRGQRKDCPILLAGVLSAPWPPGDPRSVEWRMDAIEHLRAEWGDRLRCVVAHNDESRDHLHFYATAPGLGPVKGLHPGYKARSAAAADGEDAKAQKASYESAMRAWQDRYATVAAKHGMTRLGPGRRRLSRAAWLEEQRLAEHNAKQQSALDRKAALLAEQRQEQITRAGNQENMARELQSGARVFAQFVQKHVSRFSLDELADLGSLLKRLGLSSAPAATIAPAKPPAGTLDARPGPGLKPKP